LDLKKASKAFWEDEYIATRIYRTIASRRKDKARLFERLADMEARHGALWEKMYAERSANENLTASLRLKMKLGISKVFLRLMGLSAFVRYLELSESGAIRTYGEIIDAPEVRSHRDELRAVILDEVQHEISLLSEVVKVKGAVDDVRNAVYGMVDSLVEVTAVVVGLAVVLVNPVVVALGGVISASAGTLSMSAGAYLSSKSQRDLVEGKMSDLSVRTKVMPVEEAKKISEQLMEWGLTAPVAGEVSSEVLENHELAEALGKAVDLRLSEESLEDPVSAARSAGLYYFIGSLAPIAPFVATVGGRLGIALSVVFSVALLSVASAIIAMLSGVGVKRKVAEMDAVGLAAAAATFVIGFVARTFLGIAL
jgi:VIT1/CCC1 family predicted Fe2+/Mn2+ transporter